MKYRYLWLIVLAAVLQSSCAFRKPVRHNEEKVNSIRYDILQNARRVLGMNYLYGATGKKGYDCSGLVFSLYGAQNISLPRSTQDMARYGRKISKDELLPCDLVFFKQGGKTDHVAIISRLGPASTFLIHSTTSQGVIEEILEESSYWSKRVSQYRRVIQ